MTTSDSIEKETTSARWSSQGWVPTWTYIPVHNERHQLVCSVYPTAGSYDDATRHARLIAAAPELYEVVVDFMENPNFRVAVGGNPNAVDELMARARSALAKVRGEDRSHEGK